MKGKLLFFEILAATILAGVAIYFLNRKQNNFENFALGKNTSSYFASIDKQSIHINKLNQTSLSSLKTGWINRGQKDVIFVLGNSQTHGINQKKKDHTNYAELLFRDFTPDSIEILTHSIQNANLQEHLLSFAYCKEILPIRYLVLPVFMDDLRESGIRKLFFPKLIADNFKLEGQSEIIKKINAEIKVEEVLDTLPNAAREIKEDFASLDQTVQERSELFLNNILDSLSGSWRNRPNLRGQFFVNLYILRNTVFNINAQTERPIIPQRYKENMEALKEILKYSEKSNIKVLLYIPPIRNDVKIPYNLKKYGEFKGELKSLADNYDNVSFKNFEDIVPGSLWGTKEATSFFDKEELDFMHFQYKGHQILSDSLSKSIRSFLR